MTISSSQASETFIGNGAINTFDFTFVGDAASYISVTLTAAGTTVTLDPSQYTVVLNAPATGQLWGVGGTLTYPLVGSPIANGDSITITRTLPLTQTTSISNQGAFYPQVTERALDILEMQLQQINQRTGQFRGTWLTGVDYNVGDIVVDGANGADTGNYYMCAIANLSTVWSTDLSAGDWTLAIDIQEIDTLVTEAQTAATAAAASQTAAASSATSASSSASSASTSATTASTAATNASNSATAAAGSASTASTAATNASNSATAAAGSATTASTAATSASSSASSASTSASTASTAATNAGNSATAAAGSATTASTAATNASTSATAAAGSASSASTSASSASTSATNASTSATNAAASATQAATYAAALSATSTTSLAIAGGTQTFTTQASKQFINGQYLIIASNANDTNYMHGQVTSYSGTTLVMNILDIGGSGTYADWNISISGTQGTQGPAGQIYYGTTAGGTTTYTATISGITSYFDGLQVALNVNATNTGSSTLNINSIGPVTIHNRISGSNITANEMVAGKIFNYIYSGGFFLLDQLVYPGPVASHTGAIVAQASDTTLGFLAQGTSGQALISAGNNANPVWTTEYFNPSPAANAGSLVQVNNTSDGYALLPGNTAGQTLISAGVLLSPVWTTKYFAPTPGGSSTGAIVIENSDHATYTLLGQGTSGQTLISAGANANPAWTTKFFTPTPGASGSGNLVMENSGSTDYTLLAPGTSGFVLKSNGANAALTWASQNLVLVQTQTASSATSVSFSLSSTYTNYLLVGSAITIGGSDPTNFGFRISQSGYKTSNYQSQITTATGGSLTTAGSATSAFIPTGFTGSEYISFYLHIPNIADTTSYKALTYTANAISTAATTNILVTGNGAYKANTAAIDGVQVIVTSITSGNFSGTLQLYGII